MKKLIITLLVVLLVGVGVYFLLQDSDNTVDKTDTTQEDTEDTNEDSEENQEDESETVIGSSVEGKDIKAYHYGNGDTDVLLVGGIHGGYSWNTALVGYEAVDYFEENPDVIPENVRLTVIPVLNPDGLRKVVGTTERFTASDVTSSSEDVIEGRFNANRVDLNRNFDCDWQASGTWQNRTVSGGDSAFSEPESKAIRDYVEANNPDAVVVYYSSAGGVFASSCHSGVLPETRTLTNLYADASGYAAYEEFDFYEITGDMVNWLAKEGVPAISVLLTSHSDVEWNKNRAGIEAILEHYAD